MIRKWLSTTALSGAMLVTAFAGSANAGISDSRFFATSSTGTYSGIAPILQIYAMFIVSATLQNHFFALALGRRNLGTGGFGSLNNQFGIAAGEQSSALTDNLSVWAGAHYFEGESDFAPTAFESETVGGTVGLDYTVSDYVTVGAFISYNDTDTTSAFNGGSADTQAITIGPYANFVVDDIFSVDASIAYTSNDIDNTRTVGAVVATGSQDGDSMYVSVGLNAMKWYDNVGLSGRLGWAYSDTDNDAYTDSLGTTFGATDSQLGQISLGGKVSYYGGSYMPYVGATYKYDAISDNVNTVTPPSPANDNDEVLLEAGINLFGDGPLSGGISADYSVLRDDYDGWGIGGRVSYRF